MTKIKIKNFTIGKTDKKCKNTSNSTGERSCQDLSKGSQSYSKQKASVAAPSISMERTDGNCNGNHGQLAKEKPALTGQKTGQQTIPHGIVLHCDQSQVVTCPQCKMMVQTMTLYVPGTCTYILCLFPIPCSFLSFMFDCTKDVHHHCPRCGYFFGKFQRLNC
ncbi:hypothetical protein TYRP_000037, partial [Tyrophagus putrescentiae]